MRAHISDGINLRQNSLGWLSSADSRAVSVLDIGARGPWFVSCSDAILSNFGLHFFFFVYKLDTNCLSRNLTFFFFSRALEDFFFKGK